ncbi:MAG: hypothetical protein ACR2PZ_25100 [Pseudomonadales bacterium]
MASSANGTRIDLISAPDDRYLVRLLGEALEYQGLVVTHRAPGETPKSPIGLGVLTDSGPSTEQWTPLLADYPTASLIAFANSERANQADAFVIAGWPARSSDDAVRKLAKRLKIGDIGVGSQGTNAGERTRRRRRGSEPSPVRVLLLLATVVVAAALLLPEFVENEESDERTMVTASALEDSSGRGSLASHEVTAEAGAGALSATGAATQVPTLPEIERSEPEASYWRSSSVRRFCQAKTPAAALAWIAVFSWQDKLQANREPCVAQKLASEAFAPVRAELAQRLRSGPTS